MRPSLLVLALLVGCGDENPSGNDMACAPCNTAIAMALSLTAAGSYVLQVGSPPAAQATCTFEIESAGVVPHDDESCMGLTWTLSGDGRSVIGASLAETFGQGGLISVKRDGQTVLSGSFEVRERTPSASLCACTSFYAVIFPGQGA